MFVFDFVRILWAHADLLVVAGVAVVGLVRPFAAAVSD